MAVTFLEPGGDSTFNVGITTTGGFWSTTLGSPTVATDFVHGGHVKSLKFVTGTSTYAFTPNSVVADSGGRVSFYMYINALPTSAKASCIAITNANGVSSIFRLYLTTGGVLQLWRGAAVAQIGSNGSTLSTGTWYRISIAYVITSSTVNEFRVFLNGVQDITVSDTASIVTGSSVVRVGNFDGNSAFDIRISDIYCDTTNFLIDMGDIWVTAKRPNANGSSNQFTTQIGAGGSGYGSGHSPQVNERALSTTNGWSLSNTTLSTEEYSIENTSTGDIDISTKTLSGYMGWIYAGVDSTSNSPVHKIIVANVSTSKTMSTTTTMFTQLGSSTYPAGNTDIGMSAQYTTTPHTTSLYECGIIAAYYITTSIPNPSESLTLTESVTLLISPLFVSNTVSINTNDDTFYGTAFSAGPNDTSSTLNFGGWGDTYYDYFKFDISSVPVGVTIVSAKLNVYCNGSVNDAVCQILRITSSWSGSTLTRSSHPTEDSTNRGNLASTTTVGWITAEIGGLITDWYLGTSTNFGLKINPTVTSNQNNGNFDSLEGTHIPYLTVSYLDSSGKYEALTLTESITMSGTLRVSVFDSMTTTESITVRVIILPVSVFDSMTTTESKTLLVTTLPINIFDSITLTEDVNIIRSSLGALGISVNDLFSITENITTNYSIASVNVSEILTTTENININNQPAGVNIFDGITLSENYQGAVLSNISIYDNIMISESYSDTDQLASISVFDVISSTETIGFESFRFSPDMRGIIVGFLHKKV